MQHVRTVDFGGDADAAVTTVMQKMVGLGWDISAAAPRWVEAQTGEWWEAKLEVEVIAAAAKSGSSLTIVAKPGQPGWGPLWERKLQETVDELTGALGIAAGGGGDNEADALAFAKAPMDRSKYDDRI